MSNPSTSCSSGTRRPVSKSTILSSTIVPTSANAHAISTPTNWLPTWPQWPSSPPTAFPAPKMGLITCCANTPVSSAPIVPPAPCTPKASSASSYPKAAFTLVTIPKHNTPATAPITSAGMGPTNPAAGVMATSPATAPEIAPNALALPFLIHSAALQLNAAAAAPKCVATNALDASELDASALPALNPNHPTHSRQAPMKLSTRLCGAIGCLGYPVRFPRYSPHTSADTPEEMCTTVPPAKSSVGNLPPSDAFRKPPLPHTMCASGAYTTRNHSVRKKAVPLNFMRSAVAPVINA